MAEYVSNWGEAANGPRPAPDKRITNLVSAMGVTVQMPVMCEPEALWDLVTDIGRIGEFSPECAEGWWVADSPVHAVGGRFEGRNRREADGDTFEWTRPCEVVAYDQPRLFAYTAGDRFDGTPATRWTFRITPTDAGCLVEQTFEHLPDGLSGTRLQAEQLDAPEEFIAERRNMLRDGMTQTLERIRAVAET